MVDFEKIARKVLKERTDIQYIPDLAKPIAEAIVEAIEKAELERTNFEKFKEELTVEKLSGLLLCDNMCPLFGKSCQGTISDVPNCDERITEWANQRSDQ